LLLLLAATVTLWYTCGIGLPFLITLIGFRVVVVRYVNATLRFMMVFCVQWYDPAVGLHWVLVLIYAFSMITPLKN
jgi:hypothetical protein